MMGTVSVLLVRYRMTLYPSLAFLAFVIFRIFQRDVQVPGGSIYMTAPPTLIAIGMMIMNNSLSKNVTWNIQFWIGEALVLGMFLYNSLSFLNLQNRFINAGLIIAALLLSLAFRGNVWNYGVVIGFMVFFAILVALGFPMMELLLESILNEKLKRVGNKVRHHHQILNAYYEKTANR